MSEREPTADAEPTSAVGGGGAGATAGSEDSADPTARDSTTPLPDTADDERPRPRWAPLGAVETITSGPGSVAQPASGTAAAGAAPQSRPPDDAPPPPRPAVTLVKILVLALVAAIVGALVWLVASGALDGGDGADDAAARVGHVGSLPVVPSDLPEEFRAR